VPPLKPRGEPGQRIGLLGGSFNPAHEGHLHISSLALKRLKLDQMWWLVSPQNPLKSESGMAPFSKRLAGAKKLAGRGLARRIRRLGVAVLETVYFQPCKVLTH